MPFALKIMDHSQVPEELKRLRTKGGDLSRAKDWPGLRAAEADLRTDSEFWPEYWGPMCAVAAHHTGDHLAALALLEEVMAAGFHQPELYGEELDSAFGGDEDWAQLRDRMVRNGPAAPVRLLDWPTITPGAPLGLFRLTPEREAMLREMIPPPSATAWETAYQLAFWVSAQWRHANVHMEVDDAVLCLERVAAGSRFACPEYTLVLCQSLNALGIPARKVRLAQHGYHAGLGRAHVVAEAWIDDLNRWVVLDGQHGLYWTDEDGAPLGMTALTRLRRAGAAVTGYVKAGEPWTPERARLWFSYFDHSVCTAGTAADSGFVPVIQRDYAFATVRLEKDVERLYPDLSEVAIGVEETGGRLGIRLMAVHPFATGFEVDGQFVTGSWILDSTPGQHRVEIRTRTPFGALAPQFLHYELPGPID